MHHHNPDGFRDPFVSDEDRSEARGSFFLFVATVALSSILILALEARPIPLGPARCFDLIGVPLWEPSLPR